MTTFAQDETSQSDSQPREIYEITHGVTTYRIASGERDVVYNGNVFAAAVSTREALPVAAASDNASFQVIVSATHPLVARYLKMNSPPRQILVTASRLQLTSGQMQQLWVGYITSMSISGHVAKFLVPSRTGQALSRSLPTVVADQICQHVHYDGGCRASRVANTYAAHPTFIDGRVVNVAFDVSYPAGDEWAARGELVHIASGERMTISDQVGLQITLQAVLPELRLGDSIQIVAGCQHNIPDCRDRFNNMVNYGGLPAMPTRNPFFPTGKGVGEVK